MGHARKILGNKQIATSPKFQSNKFQLEVAENFHLHIRNFRLEFDHYEFRKFAVNFIKGYTRWLINGRPSSKVYKTEGDKFLMLGESYLPALPSFFNSETTTSSLRVELQEEADYVHLHYKEFRFDFSINEFKEFASVMEQSNTKLNEILDKGDSPRRMGLFHRTHAFNRVETLNNNDGNFWLMPEDVNVKNLYESSWTDEDKTLIPNRHIDDRRLIKIDIRDLFNLTLCHTENETPWFYDKYKKNQALYNRYEFAKLYIEKNLSAGDKEIYNSAYYELLNKDINSKPRDGQNNGVYSDPKKIIKRFISLIESISQNGYSPNQSHKDFGDDVKITNDGHQVVNQTNRKGISHISVLPSGGGLRVHNGLHRLAILYALHEIGKLKDPLIEVCLLDKEKGDINLFNAPSFDQNGFPNGNKKFRYKMIEFISTNVIENLILLFTVIPTSFLLLVQYFINLTKRVLIKIKLVKNN